MRDCRETLRANIVFFFFSHLKIQDINFFSQKYDTILCHITIGSSSQYNFCILLLKHIVIVFDVCSIIIKKVVDVY